MDDENSGKFNGLMPNTLVIPARLSNNSFIHLAIMFVVNVIVITTLLAVYDFALYYDKNDALLYIAIFTYIEFIIKTVTFKSFIKYIAMTYGVILFIENIIMFATVDAIFEYNFYFVSLERLFVFTLLFTLIRLIVLTYINKKLMIRRMKKTVRWLNGKSKG